MRYEYIYAADLKLSPDDESVNIHGHVVKLSSQLTGYGHRQFLLCPKCNERVVFLRYSPLSDALYCRHCEGFKGNVYKYRTSLNDQSIKEVFDYKIRGIISKIGENDFEAREPFDYSIYEGKRPKGMHEKASSTYFLKHQKL